MIEFKGKHITREDVLKELVKFKKEYPDTNGYQNWLDDGAYTFALKYKGQLYPPKYILGQTTGLSLSEFAGGDETNRVFEELGFAVRDKLDHVKYWKIAPGPKASFWERCLRDSNIAVGWDALGDLTPFLDDFSKIKDHYSNTFPGDPPTMRGKQINQLRRFLGLTHGDIVVANNGKTSLVGRGRVVGDYRYLDDYEEYKNVIPVEWFDKAERPVPVGAQDIAAPWFGVTVEELAKAEYERLFADSPSRRDLQLLGKKKQIILYGPPGTGKTYCTRQLAVSIAEG